VVVVSRQPLIYSLRHQAARAFLGHDPDTPVAGYYRMRLRSGGVFVGIRIWYGAPLDPVTGEEMDRSHRWQATANGEPIDLERAWPKCAADPITESEHDYLAAMQAWGRENAPDSPHANPRQRINPLTAPTPF
jgi:hypothetical protein